MRKPSEFLVGQSRPNTSPLLSEADVRARLRSHNRVWDKVRQMAEGVFCLILTYLGTLVFPTHEYSAGSVALLISGACFLSLELVIRPKNVRIEMLAERLRHANEARDAALLLILGYADFERDPGARPIDGSTKGTLGEAAGLTVQCFDELKRQQVDCWEGLRFVGKSTSEDGVVTEYDEYPYALLRLSIGTEPTQADGPYVKDFQFGPYDLLPMRPD
jgi:hypothetical protein